MGHLPIPTKSNCLRDAQRDALFSPETDTTLELLQPHGPYSIEFVDEVHTSTWDMALEAIRAGEACIPKGGILILEYKTTVVTHWKSSKNRGPRLNTIQQKLHFCSNCNRGK
ncbi:hypothetical protein Trydic_g1557 [Trypoxylus dichotomus]